MPGPNRLKTKMSNIFKLKSAVWEITLDCCFSCKYCGSGGGKKRDAELSTDECIRVVNELSDLGCERVSLIGGEVFLRPDWFSIVRELTSHNIRVCIITNGFLFTDELINKIKLANVESVAVSLDSTKEVHDKYRQSGSFCRAVEAINRLAKEGIIVSVISTLNRESADMLEDFLDILQTLPIAAWQIQACSPMGDAARFGIDYRFDFSRVIDFVSRNKDKVSFAMGIADNIGYYTKDEGELRGNNISFFTGCKAGLSNIGIDCEGNVTGCESLKDDKFIEGNLREKSLADIWNDENAFFYNRKFRAEFLSGKCASCKMGPYCAGGCRSYNYFVHNKLYESPFCAG